MPPPTISRSAGRARVVVAMTAAASISCGSAGSSGGGNRSSELASLPLSWKTPAWFIDPANSTGHASDNNPCTSASLPCLTFAEVGSRWGTYSPRLRQNTTLTFLSSHADNSDPVYLSPFIENGALVSVRGTLGAAQQVATGTLANVITKNRAAGQLLRATLPAGAAADLLVVNATRSSRAWIYKSAGGSDWYLSQPLAPVSAPPAALYPPEVDTWANGDAVTLYQPVAVDLAQVTPVVADYGGAAKNQLLVYGLKVLDPGGPSALDPTSASSDVYFAETTLQRAMLLGVAAAKMPPVFVNVDFVSVAASGVLDPGSQIPLFGGVLRGVTTSTGVPAYPDLRGAHLDADVICASRCGMTGGSYGTVFVDSGDRLTWKDDEGIFDGTYGGPTLWGPGAVDVYGHARLQYPAGANKAQATFLQSGGLTINGSSTACSPAGADAGAWKCGVAITPAHLDAPVSAGGFGGTAVNPGGGSISNQGVIPGSLYADAGVADGSASGDAGDASVGNDGGDAGVEAGPMCSVYDGGAAPPGRPLCGDGWRDPATEECDDGLGQSPSTRRGCTGACQVQDTLDVQLTSIDGGPAASPRTLGGGRHPIAVSDNTFAVVALENPSEPPTLSLATFNIVGTATNTVIPISAGSVVTDDGDPAVAALSCDRYVVAWNDLNGDGDGRGVALRLVDSNAPPPMAPPAFANVTTQLEQFGPDVLWTGSSVVVAWTDTSDPINGPDVRLRTFDATLTPTSGEVTLAATPDAEGDVTLAAFEGSWAAAWRDDASGLEQIRVHAANTDWTVGPAFLPPAAGGKVALVELDPMNLLLLYPVGIGQTATADAGADGGADASAESGSDLVPNASSKLQAAVLSLSAGGMVRGTDVPVNSSVEGSTANALAHAYASAVRVGSSVYAAWWIQGAVGDPNGEQLWFQPVGWSGGALAWGGAEMSLPRTAAHRAGDQRRPALAASQLAPGGAVVAAWDDLGLGFATAEAPADVVVEVIPVPVLRKGVP
ncbi:MAG TPA: hypothetical protein VKU41_09820 [Polyangiaceae bacterium]|nr:hypothetical protein [Polyangiaceae bacterium]